MLYVLNKSLKKESYSEMLGSYKEIQSTQISADLHANISFMRN